MTENQIKMLRTLIRDEIKSAVQTENKYQFALEQEKANDQSWKTFAKFFETSMDTPNNWHM